MKDQIDWTIQTLSVEKKRRVTNSLTNNRGLDQYISGRNLFGKPLKKILKQL